MKKTVIFETDDQATVMLTTTGLVEGKIKLSITGGLAIFSTKDLGQLIDTLQEFHNDLRFDSLEKLE